MNLLAVSCKKIVELDMLAQERVGREEREVGGDGQDADEGGGVSLILIRNSQPSCHQASSVVRQFLWQGRVGPPHMAVEGAPGEGETRD